MKSTPILIISVIIIILFSGNRGYAQEKKIDNQTWTTVNLDVSTFRNGDVIPEAKTNAEWLKAIDNGKPAWCYYNNDKANGKKYGKLYNWYAVNDKRGLAPNGWHIPSSAEWNTLIEYLGGILTAGKKMKNTSGWNSVNGSNGNGSNSSGFGGLPSGYRDTDGSFKDAGIWGVWWCCKEPGGLIYASDRRLSSSSDDVSKFGDYGKSGFSVRCVKD